MRKRAGLLALALAVVMALAAVAESRMPIAERPSTRVAVALIHGYQKVVSPLLSPVVVCRFRPTCSRYGELAVQKYGLVGGGWRTAKRIVRCNPMTPAGTVDEP